MLPNIVRSFVNRIDNKHKRIKTLINVKNYVSQSASFEVKPFRLHKLEQGPSTSVTITKEDAIKLYRNMYCIRRLESTAAILYTEKVIRGFCHLYSGQEAVAVGIKASLRAHDTVITAYRAHGWVYLMGVSEHGLLAELTGRQTGCARGKGGSMHTYSHNFYGGNGIVGAQVPLGAGIAFAAKYRGTDGISVTLYGDGAANQGQVFETFNIAKLWSLPCFFVCENNGYGMGTSVERAAANPALYTRGDYIPGLAADGMDVLAVREATKFAVEYITSGKGPLIMEAATYRYFGHSMSDPGTSYRTREEIQEVRQTRDPIVSFREKLISTNLVSAEEIKKIEGEIRTNVEKAAEKAKVDKETGLDELGADVYSNNLQINVRSNLPWNPLKHKRIGSAINLK